MVVQAPPVISVAKRSAAFDYAIRSIVAEARKVEAAGRHIEYLNIGDPVLFGFQTPPHLIQAVERAMRDGHNGYTPAAGVFEAREAVAANFGARGLEVSPERVVLTAGASEGIDLALSVLVDRDDEVMVSVPTYPLYTGVLAKLGARAVYYRTDPSNGWQPDLEHIASLISPRTRALVVIDPNNPTGAVYSPECRRALIELAERHSFVLISDEGYTDLAYDGPVPPLGSYSPDAPIISFSSLSKAYLAPGWRAGWLAVGSSPRLDGVLQAIKDMADGRICSVGPMQFAVAAALNGDRSHQKAFSPRCASARRSRRSASMRSTASRAFRRRRRSTRCRRWICPTDGPTPILSSACYARPACSASTAPDSAPIPPPAISVSSTWRRPPCSTATSTRSHRSPPGSWRGRS